MIPQDKIQKICSEYDIGNHVSVKKVEEGILNDNHVLETTTGKYFIKSVREKAKGQLSMIYGVESFMKSAGIPAVAMLKTKSGDIFIADDTEVYTLYPFIEAENSSNYSGDDYRIMGKMLGKIHVAGSGDVSGIPNLKQFKRPADETIMERLKNYREEIKNKNNQDEMDKIFSEYIDFKLITAPKIKDVGLPNDTLIHGDYHPGNLLMDKQTREIIGVCDWEKTEFGPRAYELARSLLYCCFYDGYKIERALADLKLFFDGYLSIFPMEIKEIMGGLNMRIHRMALSSWLEEKYYKEHESRANHLIGHEMGLVDEAVNGKLLDQIKDLIV
jgi:Ser/Thr protein kinase RdoA (MazF antagonist)